ncbi:DUF4440 domain-containing protein [Rubrivirga sp. IMCC43871]|uniref:DUF4440 domain-containing protein n=1 Tax=Rubrivirga sp. IMCC43871 TaxID=3391575 RepID=UPI00398FD6DD
MTTTRLLVLGAALVAAPSALAQNHQGHGQADHSQQDHAAMPGMDHDAMPHDSLMALHRRMMADPEIHAAMRADSEMKALMSGTMPAGDHAGMDHGQMNHSQMPGMDHDAMMAQMRERMGAMSPADHAAFMARMQAAHVRMMATPAIHQRMMADPEMHRMMRAMPGGMDHGSMEGMDHDSMDHDAMQEMDHSSMEGMDHDAMPETDHSGMNHGQMEGMDHSQMNNGRAGEGMDHSAGVAMQRRNAGAHNGDERPATPTIGTEAFGASATADRFHAALAAGDRAAVEALLAPDAVVLEGGGHESRTEYLSHHFARDAENLAGKTVESIFRRTTVAGDAAWVASTQRIGDAEMAELLVMRASPEGWRVAAVHRSSARN